MTAAPVVYLAAGINTYPTAAYEAALAMMRAQWPHAHVVHARDAFTSTHDWLQRWPVIAPTIDALVVLPYPDGTTGLGVHTEVTMVRRRGTPVYVVDEGRLVPLAALNPLASGPIGGLTLPQRLQYARVDAHRAACSPVPLARGEQLNSPARQQ